MELKEILQMIRKERKLTTEETPFRGPSIYRNDRYVYHNNIIGELPWFHGKEEIYCEDILVFECFYHGGKIR